MNQQDYYSKQINDYYELQPGTDEISNHLLNTPWPKVTSIKSQFNTYIESNSQIYANDLFCILIDNTKAQENALPNTGVSKEFEKQLSPIFIQTENYGTRDRKSVV